MKSAREDCKRRIAPVQTKNTAAIAAYEKAAAAAEEEPAVVVARLRDHTARIDRLKIKN